MNKRYLVILTEDERTILGQRVSAGKGPARELTHARILLKADSRPHGPGWTDAAIAGALDAGPSTVERVRKRFVGAGLEAALRRRAPRREYRRKLDGEQEAHLIALACSAAARAAALDAAAAGGQAGRAAVHRRGLPRDSAARTQEERAQAVAHQALVHPAGGERRLRVADGGHPGGLHASVRPPAGR